jgi:hypothetical protein
VSWSAIRGNSLEQQDYMRIFCISTLIVMLVLFFIKRPWYTRILHVSNNTTIILNFCGSIIYSKDTNAHGRQGQRLRKIKFQSKYLSQPEHMIFQNFQKENCHQLKRFLPPIIYSSISCHCWKLKTRYEHHGYWTKQNKKNWDRIVTCTINFS